MISRFGYSLVGLFVITGVAALIGLVLWLTAGFDPSQRRVYALVIDDSVAGLKQYAPVTYNGVTVGRVKEVGLDPDAPERVLVLLDLQAQLPVRTDTRATLKRQGLTGLASIELTGGSNGAPLLKRQEGQAYPVLGYQAGVFDSVDDRLVDALDSVELLLGRLNDLLNEDSRAQLKQIVANLEAVSGESVRVLASVTPMAEQAGRVLERAEQALDPVPATLAEMDAALRQARATLVAVEGALRQMGDAGERLATQAERASNAAVSWGERGLPRLESTLRQLDLTLAELERLSRDLDERPDRLWQRVERRPGPGEEVP